MPEDTHKPEPLPASDDLVREEYRDDVCEPADYVMADGEVVPGREFARRIVEEDRRRRAAG